VTESPDSLILRALQEVAGPALVLNEGLEIVGFTEQAPALTGGPIPLGVAAAKVLCGSGPIRPVAEALAAGKPVFAEVLRPSVEGDARMIQVRATPLLDKTATRRGWLLMLEVDPFAVRGEDARVATWGLLTRDPAMKQLLRQIARVARSRASVLIRGETGSGKELVARAVHLASARSEGPFRALNCAALPPALLESELFGHTRGAFTGAVRDAPGHFRLAHGGTLFLDEVGELPLEVQAKLLRVLQERTVVPIGGREPIAVDVRIVAATHRSLREAVARRQFRPDLMYRLRVIPLFLPPLRDRIADVEMLVRHFATELEKEVGRSIQRISPGALKALEDHDWPGNVRELRNVVEYAMVMGDGPVLTDADLPPEVLGVDGSAPRTNTGSAIPQALPKEAQKLLRALDRSGGHHGRAAQSLGISRVTLWRRMRRFGLDDGAAALPPGSHERAPHLRLDGDEPVD
jgi:transcriptional regulator with PAS, ATPase and Fis domain